MMIHPEVQLMLARDRSAALRAAAEAYRRGRLARSAAVAATVDAAAASRPVTLRDGSAVLIRPVRCRTGGRLELRPVDRATAELATALASRYRLRATDATHLATAVGMGAERFITDNRRDFGPDIKEIDITYPDVLPDPVG